MGDAPSTPREWGPLGVTVPLPRNFRRRPSRNPEETHPGTPQSSSLKELWSLLLLVLHLPHLLQLPEFVLPDCPAV